MATDAIRRNAQTMIHDFWQIGPYPISHLKPGLCVKEKGFNAGINSGESDVLQQVASLAARPNEALCFWESLQIGTEVWAGPTPCPLQPNLERCHWSRRNDCRRTWLVSCSRLLKALTRFSPVSNLGAVSLARPALEHCAGLSSQPLLSTLSFYLLYPFTQ